MIGVFFSEFDFFSFRVLRVARGEIVGVLSPDDEALLPILEEGVRTIFVGIMFME